MKVVFVSNYYNHHQASLSLALYNQPDVEYYFVETAEMSEERKKLGYGISDYPPFVIRKDRFERERNEVQQLIDEVDALIFGSAPEELLDNRHKTGKVIFRYSERLYKQPFPKWKYVIRLFKNYFRYGRYKNEYMLCASAFTAYDYSLTGNYVGKTYKWGYFPEAKKYKIEQIMDKKRPGSILWVGRYIAFKHPEIPVLIADKLKRDGVQFVLNFIGSGEMEAYLQKTIDEKQLGDVIHLLGSMSPEKVRDHMENTEIFLATSDRNEGWGAVINEAMNSGCAVAASSAMGAVPFLIKDGSNGIIYEDGNIDALYAKLKKLLLDVDRTKRIGAQAYSTIVECWNAETAAQRFIMFAHDILEKQQCDLFNEGPCSKAEIIKDGWYTRG